MLRLAHRYDAILMAGFSASFLLCYALIALSCAAALLTYNLLLGHVPDAALRAALVLTVVLLPLPSALLCSALVHARKRLLLRNRD